jgi:hypothetical protein
MKKFVVFIFIIALTACSVQNPPQENAPVTETPEPKSTYIQNDYVVLSNDVELSLMTTISGRYMPSVEELEKGWDILLASVESYTELKPMNEYNIQFVGYLNENFEHLLWMNFICLDYQGDWQSSIVVVEDGGACYFNAVVNLDTGELVDLVVNGEA